MSKILTAWKKIEEAPETERAHCVLEGEQVFYVNDGLLNTIKTQRERENEARAEATKYKTQVDKFNDQIKDLLGKKDPVIPPAAGTTEVSPEILEMKKQLAALQDSLKAEQELKAALANESKLREASKKAGMRDELIPSYGRDIRFDAKGPYIVDTDGTPKIKADGSRVTPEDHFAEVVKTNPWAAVEKPAGSGPQLGGLGGKVQSSISPVELSKLSEQYREAIVKGDLKAVDRLARKAQENGIQIT